jgi:hypothetical protein
LRVFSDSLQTIVDQRVNGKFRGLVPWEPVGAAVEILGNHLTGATSVSVGVVKANFSVTSSTLISKTVPAGATSGSVKVVTPAGPFEQRAFPRIALI